ncbi:hypothetical protein V493_08376, partial [Pseudogymnoascus sp. VKM F-4281 (FW-2241)]
MASISSWRARAIVRCRAVHFAARLGDSSEPTAREDVDEEFRGRHGRCGGEGEWVYGGERGHGAVGDAVGEGTESDHHEDFDAVAVDVFGEDGAAGEEGAVGPDYVGAGADEPPLHAVDEARDGEGSRVPEYGREGGDEDEGEADEPAAGEGAPFYGDGGERREEGFRVHDAEDADGCEEDVAGDEEDALGYGCRGPEGVCFVLQDLGFAEEVVGEGEGGGEGAA